MGERPAPSRPPKPGRSLGSLPAATPPLDPPQSPHTRPQSHPPAPAPQTTGTNHPDSEPQNSRSISASAAVHPAICSSDRPLRGWIRHRIPAIRSLITLIARRAIGVSANRRRLAGVGLGTTLCCADAPVRDPAPGSNVCGNLPNANGARFDPAPIVRRAARAPTPAKTTFRATNFQPLPQRHFSHPAHRAANRFSNVHDLLCPRRNGRPLPSSRNELPRNYAMSS